VATDDYYRIPAIMQDCKTAYSLSWQDGGAWNGYTYVRKATMPNINGVITFKATVSIARKPKYFLGIKIHRAIVQISWELTTEYTDTYVADVLTFDPDLPEEEKERTGERPYCGDCTRASFVQDHDGICPYPTIGRDSDRGGVPSAVVKRPARNRTGSGFPDYDDICRPRVTGEDDALQTEHHRRAEGRAARIGYGRGTQADARGGMPRTLGGECAEPAERKRQERQRQRKGGAAMKRALLMAVDIISTAAGVKEKMAKELQEKGYTVGDREYILVTGHRRENFGDGFLHICKAIKELAALHPEMDIVYPVHLNPNVQKPVYELLSGLSNVYLISPLDYLPFIYAMQHSTLLLTDSGGVQEEAPSLGKPVLVMRDTTERPEAVEAGTVKLVGTDAEAIVSNVTALLQDKEMYKRMSETHNPYGDGQACERIIAALR
jgi:hypothetical protein